MTTRLDKTLKRELDIDGRTFSLVISPDGIKISLKGKRKGQQLRWVDLVSGDAALAAALNASVGRFASPALPRTSSPAAARKGLRAPKARASRPKAKRHRPR